MNITNYPKQRKALLKELKTIAEQKGITQQHIADKTDMQRPHVSRAFSGDDTITLDTFLKLAKAIGCKIEIKK